MPFLWVTIVEELDEGKTFLNSRILINTDQICSLNPNVAYRSISMSDAGVYKLSLVSLEEVIEKLEVNHFRPPLRGRE